MDRHRPHHTQPRRESVRVVLAYKNFAANKGISHIGLGVAALNTSATLRRLGYWVDVWPVTSAADLDARLTAVNTRALEHRGEYFVSHVVVSAPWIPTADMQRLLMTHSSVYFATVSHSNIGFLMADPSGIRLLREACELTIGHHNYTVGGNCQRFCDAWSQMYGTRPVFLPNLYDTSTIRHVGQRMPWRHGPLRIGVFGATRPLKNQVTAVAAAIELGSRMRTDVEVFTSSGRVEGGGVGGGTVDGAIQQLVAGLAPHVVLRPTGWRTWPAFRQVVSRMHVLINPSYTESFNMCVADGIAEGVSSVVSDAIPWVPGDWSACADDAGDIARVAGRLIHDEHAVDHGQRALRKYVADGTPQWESYLLGDTNIYQGHHQ